ncbi:YceI family protein [uncultured Litoreibacter sp.]|uniref:YceI family protein n=1 Tax=uncultured Litoreibacter sp. TaxID=1392394 RepID=UPI00263A041C|nr:YceI family protein [uncultured Litoreibacter sp.]
MFKSFKTLALVASLMAAGSMAYADGHAKGWTLDGDNSRLVFGSIKGDTTGEAHSFNTISGAVGADGAAMIEVDLASVQTNIDIRNERMLEHVFKGAGTATLSANIDMSEVSELPVGGMTTFEIEGTLSLLGSEVDLDAEMFAVRLSDTSAMVTTNNIIFVETEDLGITEGVNKLMELASLDSITRTSPVVMRLVFNLDE